MKLYIEPRELGHYSHISFYSALEAFYMMGFEVIEVKDFDTLLIEEDNIFLGSIQFIYKALDKFNVPIPEPLDYPESLRAFLGRKIWTSSINEIANNPEKWDVFVKPKGYAKKFTGRLVQSTTDLVGCGDLKMNTPVWVSEPKNFLTEWRVFVRYDKILGVKIYKGDWRNHFDYKVIEKAVTSYKNAPKAYALDFGVTEKDETLLIEANDGFALGNYGLFYTDYAKLLSARWAELTQQTDLCNF